MATRNERPDEEPTAYRALEAHSQLLKFVRPGGGSTKERRRAHLAVHRWLDVDAPAEMRQDGYSSAAIDYLLYPIEGTRERWLYYGGGMSRRQGLRLLVFCFAEALEVLRSRSLPWEAMFWLPLEPSHEPFPGRPPPDPAGLITQLHSMYAPHVAVFQSPEPQTEGPHRRLLPVPFTIADFPGVQVHYIATEWGSRTHTVDDEPYEREIRAVWPEAAWQKPKAGPSITGSAQLNDR